MRVFALKGSEQLGAAVARAMGVALNEHEERTFEDGEHKARPLISVRDEDVFILHSLNADDMQSPNDKLMHLLLFIATCRENGARRITALAPYLAYGRKDRQTKPRDPVTTRYIAQLFEAVGVDCVVTLDAHNFTAFQNAFRCSTVHLNTRKLFAQDIAARSGGDDIVIFSPDGGGVKRAQLLKEMIEQKTQASIGFGFIEKRRSRGVVSGDLFAGEVDGASVYIVDDMMSTGGTMLRAAKACRARGAQRVFAYATHGLFAKGADKVLASPDFDKIIVTDSAAPFRIADDLLADRVEVLSCAELLGETIMRLHGGGSIHRLLEDEH